MSIHFADDSATSKPVQSMALWLQYPLRGSRGDKAPGASAVGQRIGTSDGASPSQAFLPFGWW